jgi:hypothetical protein
MAEPRRTRGKRLRSTDLMQRAVGAGALALLLLALPGAAMANTGSATLSCNAASLKFAEFLAGSNTIHYQVKVDATVAAAGEFKLDQKGGTDGLLDVPLDISGTHQVSAYAWWEASATVGAVVGGSATIPLVSRRLDCPAPPASGGPAQGPGPSPAPAPGSPTPTPTPTSTSTPKPAAGAPTTARPVATRKPKRAVKAERTAVPARIAKLVARTSCPAGTVRLTVKGRQLHDVAFSINGRPVRTVRVRPGSTSAKETLAIRDPAAAEVITARVRFRNGAAPRTLSARTSRCAKAPVAPQFTG